ncbi:uncharacterized protein LOC127851508 isoform X2 [Dreissena polymorpha]|uniref:uncharacterized protein LOC127851508 isoform X2 n=1 Tax=Dreissena polymorpha TaxID=45954 RepID=UPI002263FD2B|nr:uncharacterized protein LOC127851508 isoform X2 [Dreissena polymorpha]
MCRDDERRTWFFLVWFRWCCGKVRRLGKSTSSKYDIELADSSSGNLKVTPSQENDRDESDGQKIKNIYDEKFTPLQKEQKSNTIQISDIEAKLYDRTIVIEQLQIKIKELERDNVGLTNIQKNDGERYRAAQTDYDTNIINEMDIKIKKLNGYIKALYEEKQDTLRRMRGVNSKYCSEGDESASLDESEYPNHPQSSASFDNVPNENEGQNLTQSDNEGLTSLQSELVRLQGMFQNLEILLNDQNTIIKHNAALNISLTDQKEKMEKEFITQKQQHTNILNEKERQIQKLNEEKQEALRRLSAMMSIKLRDNNPNIADLSDQFRPTKLGEQFSELYDNEWTDAFDVLQNKFEERHAISVLLDIAMDTYWFCEKELSEEWKLTEKWFIQTDAPSAQQIKKTLKDARKQTLVGRVSEIEEKYIDYLLTLCSNDSLTVLVNSAPVKCYIASCVRLTLLMTANDPPVVIECPGWQPFSERPYEERETDVSTKEQESTIGLCELTATLNKDDSDSSMNNNSFQEEIKPNTPDGITIGKNHKGEFVALGESNIKSGDLTSDTKTFAQEGNIVEIPTELPSAEINICAKSNDTVNNLADSSENQVDSFGTTPNPIEFVNQPSGIKNDENTTQNKKTAHQRAKESKTNENDGNIQLTKERHDFDKDKFKEYTSRGQFVDYFVWPIMYLHRDGPMLAKGIAQGCKKKVEDVSQEPFVWWKRLPTSQM